MNFLVRVAICLMFFVGVAAAEKSIEVLSDVTVNELLKQGYKLVSTDSIGFSTPSGDGYGRDNVGLVYHLIKGDDLIHVLLLSKRFFALNLSV
jgi:hypothetical protein